MQTFDKKLTVGLTSVQAAALLTFAACENARSQPLAPFEAGPNTNAVTLSDVPFSGPFDWLSSNLAETTVPLSWHTNDPTSAPIDSGSQRASNSAVGPVHPLISHLDGSSNPSPEEHPAHASKSNDEPHGESAKTQAEHGGAPASAEHEKTIFRTVVEGLTESSIKIVVEAGVVAAAAAFGAIAAILMKGKSSTYDRLDTAGHYLHHLDLRSGNNSARLSIGDASSIGGNLHQLLPEETHRKCFDSCLEGTNQRISIAHFPVHWRHLFSGICETAAHELNSHGLHLRSYWALRGGLISTLLSARQDSSRTVLMSISSGEKEDAPHNLVTLAPKLVFGILNDVTAAFREIDGDRELRADFLSKLELLALACRKMPSVVEKMVLQYNPDLDPGERKKMLEAGRRLGAFLILDREQSTKFITDLKSEHELPALEQLQELQIETELQAREKQHSKAELIYTKILAFREHCERQHSGILKAFKSEPIQTLRELLSRINGTMQDENDPHSDSGWIHVAEIPPAANPALGKVNLMSWVEQLIEARADPKWMAVIYQGKDLADQGKFRQEIARAAENYFEQTAGHLMKRNGELHNPQSEKFFLTELHFENTVLGWIENAYHSSNQELRPPLTL